MAFHLYRCKKYIYVFYLDLWFFLCYRVRQTQKTKMSLSQPLTSQRTYLKFMILTLRSIYRFPMQVRWFYLVTWMFFVVVVFKHRSGCKQEPLHFWNKPSFLFSCPAEAKSLSVSSNALPVKDGAPRRSLNLEDYKKRRGLIWCSQCIQNPHCMCNWLYNWESVWECGWEQERERLCVCVNDSQRTSCLNVDTTDCLFKHKGNTDWATTTRHFS